MKIERLQIIFGDDPELLNVLLDASANADLTKTVSASGPRYKHDTCIENLLKQREFVGRFFTILKKDHDEDLKTKEFYDSKLQAHRIVVLESDKIEQKLNTFTDRLARHFKKITSDYSEEIEEVLVCTRANLEHSRSALVPKS